MLHFDTESLPSQDIISKCVRSLDEKNKTFFMWKSLIMSVEGDEFDEQIASVCSLFLCFSISENEFKRQFRLSTVVK